jgi:hypothetical protein
LNKSITAGTGLTGGGLLTVDRSLAVDLTYAFTWSALHTFNAGARIAAGQNLEFGADVALTRSAANILGLASGDAFRSTGYASGVNGWMIDAAGNAEFNNVRVRGALHCAVFVKDLIEARAGSMLVTKSGGVLYADMTVPTSGTWTATIEDPPGGGFLFADGDICRCKTEYASGIADIWFTVSGRTDNGDGTQGYTCTYSSGDRSVQRVYPAGAPVVDYGVSGDGGLLLTADDGVGNAPFLSVFTHAGSPWSTQTEHLRLGNLNGLADYAADAYGIFIGDYAGGKWLSYDPTNSLRIRGDALVEGTVTADKLGIGNSGFLTSSYGLVLLSPYNISSTTSWTSTRGHVATIAGAFQTMRGRFPGTKALLIEKAWTNKCINPSFATNATSWTPASLGSVSRVSTQSLYDGYSLLVESGGGQAQAQACYNGGITGFSATQPYVVSFWYKLDDIPAGGNVDVLFYWTGGAQANAYTTLTVGTSKGGEWRRIEATATPDYTDRTGMNLYIRIWGATADGQGWYLDGVDIAQNEKVGCYQPCIGSMAWCSWTGTAHASTSTRLGTSLALSAHAAVLSGETTFTIRTVFQVPDDHDATNRPGNWINVWDLAQASGGANRLAFFYDWAGSTTGSVQWALAFFDASSVGSYLVGTYDFHAGDWLDTVVTVDTSNTRAAIYINGERIALDEAWTVTLPASFSKWLVGGSYGGSGQANLAVSEYSMSTSEWSPAFIAELYKLNRVLPDLGPTEDPGIYITDGRFRIASASTGTRIEIVNSEIAGYNGATKQFWLSATDGKAYCGGGKIVLGEHSYIKFLDLLGNERAGIGWEPSVGYSGDYVSIMGYNGTDSAGFAAQPAGASWMWAYDATYNVARYWWLDGRYGARFTNQAGGVGMVEYARISNDGALGLKDGITAPAAVSGLAQIYIDTADGDLKVKFADGVTKTLATDT